MNRPATAWRGVALAVALLACLGGLVGGCGDRPGVRLLVDERARAPLEEAANLFEMRTGHRVRRTYASARRLQTLLFTGSHDLVVADHAQLAEHPVTSAFDPETERILGSSREGVVLGSMLRRTSMGRAEPRGLWLFLQEAEARAMLDAAGIRLAPDAPTGGKERP